MITNLSKRLPLITAAALMGLAALALTFASGAGASNLRELPAGTDPATCIRTDFTRMVADRGQHYLTVQFTNECAAAISGGLARVLVSDAHGGLMEDGLTQVPALGPGQAGRDEILFQYDLTGMRSLTLADVVVDLAQ